MRCLALNGKTRGLTTCAGMVLAGMLAILVGGCATAPKKQEPVFFPSPPEPPRLQYLTHYAEAQDIEPPQNWFYYFLTGADPARKMVVKPYGLALHDSKLFVCDTILNAIETFDFKARRFDYFTSHGAGKLGKPLNLAVDTDGTCYVADGLRQQVLVYANSNRYAGAVGEDMKPVDVLVASNRLYVADMKNRRVRVFDKTTQALLLNIPKDPKDASEDLVGPSNLALDSEGHLHVADSRAFRIQVYDGEGRYLRTLGRHGDAMGEFARPKGIAIDREDRLYVVDAASQLIQIFDKDGNLLLYFGEPDGSPVSLILPAAVIIDYDHVDLFRSYAAPNFEVEYVVLVTSQYGNRKITVFGFGREKTRADSPAPVPGGAPSPAGGVESLSPSK